jgi:L-2,4-diaminobutyrate decarboxylase
MAMDAYQAAVRDTVAALLRALPRNPYSGASPAELKALLGGEICPAEGLGLSAVQASLAEIVRHSVLVTHPHVAAHLHCPPLIDALAAELVISALNQSMDSFDQAPAATIVELAVTDWLCRLAGLPAEAGGTFTGGGTLSNYMGLLLARDAHAKARDGWSVRRRGLPESARRYRILCSEVAHFSIEKSAAQLGLGTDAVIGVAVDDGFRMSASALRDKLDSLRREGLAPIAVVGTAGTTDFGSIDPLAEIAELTREHGVWFHVDAAYGGGLLLSDESAHLLAGIERADSITMDFHKLFWQPVSCGALLIRDARMFELIEQHAEYLNPESHAELGIPDLVTRSVLTTRRFDALKLWVSLRSLGRRTFGRMVEHTRAVARAAADFIRESPRLELIHAPTLGCVVFRYLPARGDLDAGMLNERIRRTLFDEGVAVLGQTRVRGRVCLKLTLLNPAAGQTSITDLLEAIAARGAALEERIQG